MIADLLEVLGTVILCVPAILLAGRGLTGEWIWDFWARLDAEDAAQRQRIDMIARADVLDSPDHGKA